MCYGFSFILAQLATQTERLAASAGVRLGLLLLAIPAGGRNELCPFPSDLS
jgi:hypothetical protein